MARYLLLCILGAFLFGAIFTPLVFAGLEQWLDDPPPFSRAFNRVTMLGLLILLIALRKRVGFDHAVATFKRPGRRLRDLGLGYAIALVTAGAALAVMVSGPLLDWERMSAGDWALMLLEALVSSLLVGVIEEGFFRVVVFGGLREQIGLWAAAIGSSLFYAYVHFLTSDRSYAWQGFDPLFGFGYLGRIFANLAQPGVTIGVVGLFLIGLTLCFAYHRLGSIWLCVGLHAGWVIVARLAVSATHLDPTATIPAGLNKRYLLVAQPITWISIAAAAGGLALILYRGRSVPHR